MAIGIKVWTPSGSLVLDGTKRVGRIIAVQNANTSGSYSDSRFADGGTPFCAFQRYITFHTSWGTGGLASPQIVFSGNSVSWTFPTLQDPSHDELGSGILIFGTF